MIIVCHKCQRKLSISPADPNEVQDFNCPDCAQPLRYSPAVKAPAVPAVPATRLIKCKDCDGAISRIANSCPHCGRMIFPIHNLAELLVKFGIAVVLLVIFCALALAFLLKG